MLCLAIGCGGGGGGGNTDQGAIVSISLVALYNGTSSPIVVNSTPLSPGDHVQFELQGQYDETGQVATIHPSGFTTNAPASVATLSSSGLLTAIASSGGRLYSVSLVYKGTTYGAEFSVGSPAAHVVGNVVTSTGNAVSGAQINFVTKTGAVAGSTVTGTNGSFIAAVPTSATNFTVDFKDSTNLNYPSLYDVFSYNSFTYSAAISSCEPALPTLKVGTVVTLPHSLVVFVDANTDPPPPPDGCQ